MLRVVAEVASIALLYGMLGGFLWLAAELLRTDRPSIDGRPRRRPRRPVEYHIVPNVT
jgi:hypothetical protein